LRIFSISPISLFILKDRIIEIVFLVTLYQKEKYCQFKNPLKFPQKFIDRIG
jgi:hypothetical protein